MSALDNVIEERDMWRSLAARPDERVERLRVQNERLGSENARITTVSVDYAIERDRLRSALARALARWVPDGDNDRAVWDECNELLGKKE